MQQVEPVLRRACGDDLHIQRVYTPGHAYYDRASGISAHTDMVIAPLDIGKVLVYSPGLDVDTNRWLWDNGYTIIEADVDEQVNAAACNLIPLEPGRVIMHAGAQKTVDQVRRAGVDVTTVDYSEYNRFGAGIHCATMQILRDPGPRKFT